MVARVEDLLLLLLLLLFRACWAWIVVTQPQPKHLRRLNGRWQVPSREQQTADWRTTSTHLRISTSSTSNEEIIDQIAAGEAWGDSSGRDGNDDDSVQQFSTHEWEVYLLNSEPPPRHSSRAAIIQNKQQQQPKPAKVKDPFWEQIRADARKALHEQASLAGPQLYQGILSHKSFLKAICTVISHEIENDLIGATEIRDLFLEHLTPEDEYAMRLDLQAVATRSPSVETAMEALLFHKGFHSLVCYRVGHRLWLAKRQGLAYYMQSIVSRIYAADIHPACRMGYGLYMRGPGCGIVIGETVIVGNDTSILEGVTLGGTGKEAGDRHPKVGSGVILGEGATVLGNIPVGDGSIVMAKSIVTKPVPPLAIVNGVPAKIVGTRDVLGDVEDEFKRDDMHEHLLYKYLPTWKEIALEQLKEEQAEKDSAGPKK